MNEVTATIVVGFFSFIGTLVGALGGILTSNKLTNYKIEELRDKLVKVVEQNESTSDTVAAIKEEVAVVGQRVTSLERRVKDLEAYHKEGHK